MTRSFSFDDLAARYFGLLLAAVMFSAAVVYAAMNAQFKTGSFNDDAVYVLASQDLDNSSLSKLYPAIKPDRPLPGLPLLLAGASQVSTDGLRLFEWVMPAVAVASLFLLGWWSRRWLSAGEALVAVALYAFNPTVARYAGIVMPETAFAAACVGSYLLLGKTLERPTAWSGLGLGILAGWGAVMRPEGALLAVCVLAPLASFARARRAPPAAPAGVAVWIVVTVAWFHTHRAANTEFGSDVSALMSYWSAHFLDGARFTGRLLQALFVNAVSGVKLSSSAVAVFARTAVIAVCVAIIAKGIRSVLRSAHAVEVWSALAFCLSYLVIHLFWHVAQDRYFVPLLPFLFVFLVRGARTAIASSTGRMPWIQAAAIVVVAMYGVRDVRGLAESLAAPDPIKSPPWRSLAWLEENAAPDDRVVSIFAPSVTLYTGHGAASILANATSVERFTFDIYRSGYRYIADRPLNLISPGVGNVFDSNRWWARVRRWVRRYPDRFPLVYSNPREQVNIYHIEPEPHFMSAYRDYRRAAAFFFEGRIDEGVMAAQACLDAFPKMGCALNLMGIFSVMREDYSDGEQYFLKALAVKPKSSVTMLNLAIFYRQIGRPDLSQRFLELGLRTSRENGREGIFNRNLKAALSGDGRTLFIDT